MSEMHRNIEALCLKNGIKIGTLCANLGISRGVMSNLKNGSTKKLAAETVQKIADYFEVSTDVIYGREEKRPTPESEGGPIAEFFELMGQLSPEEQKLILSQIKGILSNRE